MSLRQRATRQQAGFAEASAGVSQRGLPSANGYGAADGDGVYNIIPIHNLLAEHPALRFPEVRAAMAALRTVGDLRKPPFVPWQEGYDLLDWLGFFFGFQRDNVRNQREHLVLLLANAQMRIQPPPDNIDALDANVARRLRRKLLRNYTAWCSYLGRKSNVWISDKRRSTPSGSADYSRRDLLYTALYLLVWGEAANLRFVPECLLHFPSHGHGPQPHS
ncbi:hypothetical protein HPP92_024476 [Vanilla planifolia]|uniref:1,3-beta-glucan synthase component FKS1-like domain-containing protein n=1 Tax=Vanilla planifolia TaxID=51239 RepID=A0A835PPT3_VANPL|nr:hypothetical protein HPP92_024476 [Vanilla planifolia]